MVKTCPGCKKIYAPTPFGMCYECREKELEDEDKVRDYLRENNRASIEQISTNTGVKLETIKKMMKSGRLQGEGATVEYPCDKCRKPITEGRLCYECAQSIKSQMEVIKEKQAVTQSKKAEDGTAKKRRGMYIDNVYR